MKNHIKIKTVILTIMLLIPMYGCATKTDIVRDAIVNLRIVDDEGTPVEGVNCKILSMAGYDTPTVLSDNNGMCSVQLKNIHSEIMGWFYKQGYYKSNGTFWKLDQTSWNSKLQIYTNTVPPADNLYTVEIKRIIEPVQMKKREFVVYAPRLDEPVGFDLEIGDLVFPEGKGKVTDILLTTCKDFVAADDFACFVNIEFVGEQSGIQSFSYWTKEGPSHPIRSDLMPPSPIAPESGYTNILERFSKCSPPSEWNRTRQPGHYAYNKNVWSGSFVENRKWVFRTRTVLDDDGKIIAANYGWTTTEIKLVAKPESDYKVLGFSFTYYYNPDSHSRSLEPKEIADRQNRD